MKVTTVDQNYNQPTPRRSQNSSSNHNNQEPSALHTTPNTQASVPSSIQSLIDTLTPTAGTGAPAHSQPAGYTAPRTDAGRPHLPSTTRSAGLENSQRPYGPQSQATHNSSSTTSGVTPTQADIHTSTLQSTFRFIRKYIRVLPEVWNFSQILVNYRHLSG